MPKHSTEFDDLPREWYPQERLEYLWDYGWARLSEDNLSSIIKFTKETGILEMGGGSGHVAQQLSERGAKITTFDTKDDDFTFMPSWANHPNIANVIGGGEKILKEESFHTRALMIVWPHSGICRVVEKAMGQFTKIIYVGEMPDADGSGTCAPLRFFNELDENGFQLVEEMKNIDNFAYQYGKILLFEKGAPEKFPRKSLSWKKYFDRHAKMSFEAAKFYMSVRDVTWYRFAYSNLNSDYCVLKNVTTTKKYSPHTDDLLTNELIERFESVLQECQSVISELDPESQDVIM